MGMKAPTASAEIAMRAPNTAPEHRRIFASSTICDPTSPTETHHGCGNGQDKSISGLFDNTTFAGRLPPRPPRARRCGATTTKAVRLKIPEPFLLRVDEAIE